MSIRVAIFEDNNHLRKSLTTLIESSGKMMVCGAFQDCNTLMQDVRKCNPDVILMDIRMPGTSGIDGLKLIKQTWPDKIVVMQTVFDSDDKIVAAICGGANGYILKNSTPETYLQSVEDAFHGGAPMTPSVAAKVLQLFQQQVKGVVADRNLSERETEVLRELVKGKSYKMIANDLNVSYATVRFHMKNIYEKLHVASMTEAVAKAIQEKLT
ncbi:MAG: response regulator transcription factor [Cyclobacteriaceae bacterium]|nr:response regulator transcription factor [Cyclobacteriaceae bacterium]